jgi:hypothetical protein
MKRYLITSIAVIVVLTVALVAFGQQNQGERPRMRGGFNREAQQNAVATIETELAKIKKSMETPMQMPEGGFQNMSEEERTKFREQRMKEREEQTAALDKIEQQIMILKGGRQLQQEHQAKIDELQTIQAMAQKENATKTAKYVEDMIAKSNKDFEAMAEKLGIRLGRGGMGGGQRGGGQGGNRQRNN